MVTYQQIITHLADASIFAGEVLAFAVLLATLVTSKFPSRSEQYGLDHVLRFLNLLAGNVGTNRNADDQ